jgi:predicted RNA methylase
VRPVAGWYRAAYRGVEAAENFRSRAELDAYRRGLLEKTRPQAAFVLKQVDRPMRLLEIGTGNGRLPICLAAMDAIEHALGVDVSASRIEFARRWADDAGFAALEFEVCDVLEAAPPDGGYDVVACITGTFGYFAATDGGLDRTALRYAAEALTRGGKLILELYTHPVLRERCLEAPHRTVRYWEALAPEDAFTWYLHEVSYDPERSVLGHRKIFIRREDGLVDDGRREYLRIYGEGELERLLEEEGFHLFAEADGLRGGDADRRYGTKVIVARKE